MKFTIQAYFIPWDSLRDLALVAPLSLPFACVRVGTGGACSNESSGKEMHAGTSFHRQTEIDRIRS